jgi:type I restriction enzyme, S subunit
VGWKTVRLGDVCIFENGDRGKNYPGRKAFVEKGVPFINAGHLTDTGIDIDNMDYIPRERFHLLSNGKIQEGDLLFCLRGSLGKFAVVEGLKEGAIASSLVIVRPTERLSRHFLAAYFGGRICANMIEKFENGTAQPNLSAKSLSLFEIPLPPLAEQKRIVAILDEAFEGIGVAVANAEKNLANARELFDNFLNSVFTQKGKGWIEKPLGEIGGDVYTGPFGSLLHKSDYILGGVPLVNPAHIVDGKIVPDEEKTVDASAIALLKNYLLSKGDVVIGRRGEIGRCAVVTAIEEGWLCGTGCFYIRVFKRTNPYFLTHLLRSKRYRESLEALSSGATMLNLSNTSLSELSICLPNLEEQNSIVAKVETLSSRIEDLESIYRQKLDNLADLKQAVLQKAFAGELTAQPEQFLQGAVA